MNLVSSMIVAKVHSSASLLLHSIGKFSSVQFDSRFAALLFFIDFRRMLFFNEAQRRKFRNLKDLVENSRHLIRESIFKWF